ncbi:tetratricopeptide repeat protein [Neolewinella antarctica]|uniref:Tetratricopeptide (TPR) repeat protein n=1 Tax=Neolewinella antarctica TaxID=442734 RepID=A0ABX0XET4_9BACT|nr:tetratricopeptide repeat protein [Neolewinella antarctica]NJC27257.1 tetratricopeptide (TPR) repeat protein [Neolewinella antarctica]
MSNKRNEQRDLALKQLVANFEEQLSQQKTPFLSQEQFEDLLGYYFDRDDFDLTLHAADLAIEQHAYTPEFYKWKALIHKINLQEREAFAALEKLAIYAPNDEECQMLRLEIYVHFGKTTEAKELLDVLYARVEGRKKKSLLFFFQGLVLLQEGDVTGSWHALLKAIKLDPNQEPALDEALNAGEFDHLRGGLGEKLRNVLDKNPFNHLVWYYLGMWYDDYGNDFKAMDAFANARSLNQKEARYELDYADKLFDLNRHEAALAAYQAYFELPGAETTYETYMRVGRSYQMLDHFDLAKEAYFRAAEADPQMYDCFQHLGECFAAEGKWGMAAHNYGRAVELPGHTAECFLGLGLCLSAQNEAEPAEIAYQKAIAADARYSDAIVSFAIFLVDNGREGEGLDLMQSKLKEYEDANLLYGMVAVCLVANKRSQALEYLNEALASYREDQDMLLEWYPDLRNDHEINAIFELYKS